MFRINTAPGPSTGNGMFPIQFFDSAEEGVYTRAIPLRFYYPVAVSVAPFIVPAAAADYAAFLESVIEAALGSLTLSFGKSKTEEVLYDACGGFDMRCVHRYVYGVDLLCSAAPGSTLPIGANTIVIEVRIPFETPLISTRDARSNMAGWNQVRQMQLRMQEGAALSLTGAGGSLLVRSTLQSACDVDQLCIDAQGGPDQWGALLRLNKQTSATLSTPLNNGVTLAVWEANANYNTTAIIQFTAYRKQGTQRTQVATDTPIYVPDDVYTVDYVDGHPANIDDQVTMLWSALQGCSMSDLMAGQPTFTFPTAYYQNWQFRQLYFPVIDDTNVNHYAGISATATGAGVTLGRPDSAAALPAQIAASSAVQVYNQGTPNFLVRPGTTVARPNAQPAANIPTHIKDQIAAVSSAGSNTNADTASAAAANAAGKLANLSPGHTTAAIGQHDTSGKGGAVRSSFAQRGVLLPK